MVCGCVAISSLTDLDERGETEGLEALEAAAIVVWQAAGVLELSRLIRKGCHAVSTIGVDWSCGAVVELEALEFPRHPCRSFRHAVKLSTAPHYSRCLR